MALGYLFLMFVVMSVLALVGAVLLFVVKNQNANDVILVVMAAYALTIAYFSATALPVNFVAQQVLAWVVGAVGAAGVAVRFLTKKQLIVTKIMVVASVIVGLFGLFFV